MQHGSLSFLEFRAIALLNRESNESLMIGIEIEERVEDASPGALRSPSSFPTSEPSSQTQVGRRRLIDYRAGRALELLGHAIEYLADELVEEGGTLTAGNARVQAMVHKRC